MESRDGTRTHVLEIPMATNGSAKWTIYADDVPHLLRELVAAEAAITQIAELAGRIVTVTCGAPAAPKGGKS